MFNIRDYYFKLVLDIYSFPGKSRPTVQEFVTGASYNSNRANK